jgi:hypothetical protein
MIKRTLAIAVLIHLFPTSAYSDGRINFRIDFNRMNVEGVHDTVDLGWQGLEVEVEKELATHKVVLSGFSLGIRREVFYGFTGFGTSKDVHRWDEGTYLTFRMFRNFDLSGKLWSVGPSFAVFYGVPGTTLDRTVGSSSGDARYDYTHVFPMRNADVPRLLADKAQLVRDSALFYPEASFSVRRRLARGGVVFDWLVGIRVIRFGVVDSNSQGDAFRESRMFIPSVGMRVGFRIF